MLSFDVVIPCYNPKDGWAEHLANSFNQLNELVPQFTLKSLIIVNDGSLQNLNDQYGKLENQPWNLQVVEHGVNQGKGAAIRSGLSHCSSPTILFTDVDVPYRLEDMGMMIQAICNDEQDLALGIRGGSYYDSLSGFRRMVSKGLVNLNKQLFGLQIGDTQGGLKAMNEKGKKAMLDTTIDRYLFDLEAVKIASKTGLRIKGIEVRLQPGIQLPSLGLNVLLQESGNLLKLLFRS